MLKAEHLIAHRGWQARFPENSLVGIQAAIEAGMLHIECDVQLTADLTPMLCHDIDLQRLSGQSACISQLSQSQLQHFNAHEPQRLGDAFKTQSFHRLQDLMVLMKHSPEVNFYIELKEESIDVHGLESCLRVIQPLLEGVSNAIFISFHAAAVQQIKHIQPIIRTGIVLRDWQSRESVIEQVNADVAYISKRRLPLFGELIASVPIAVYEISTLKQAKQLLSRGVSLIESFNAPELLQSSRAWHSKE